MPRIRHLESYAAIVRDRAARARLVAAGRRIVTLAAAAEEDTRGLVAQAERLLSAVTDHDERRDWLSAEQLVHEGIQHVDRLLARKHGTTGLGTGFVDFDEMSRGLQPGSLVIVAARPSMGKSAFALNVAAHVAAQGSTVGFFSLEMSRQELFVRLAAAGGRVDGHQIQSGYVREADCARLSDAYCRIGSSSLFVDDSAAVGVLDLRCQAKRLQARHGLHLLIVDYLQLMQLPTRAENRNVAIADISRGLKLLSRELAIPVVALSQLSRETERRGGDRKPMMSDLRDSGALEQDADLIVFIHRPEVYQPTPENAGLAEIIIAKQRNGPTGTIRLRWSKEWTRFDNWSTCSPSPTSLFA
jgi:replicative DNA helicase